MALEALVEETHRALVQDGLIDDVEARADVPLAFLQASVDASAAADAKVPDPLTEPPVEGYSLDAVDRALEELKRGLAEIDQALTSPSPGV